MTVVAVVGGQWGDEGKGKIVDLLEEEARGARSIGTTRRGIGPAYADKVARIGIRMGDLLDEETFSEKLATVLDQKNHILKQLYCASPLSYDDLKSEHMLYSRRLSLHI